MDIPLLQIPILIPSSVLLISRKYAFISILAPKIKSKPVPRVTLTIVLTLGQVSLIVNPCGLLNEILKARLPDESYADALKQQACFLP